jgi:hypothetical protein
MKTIGLLVAIAGAPLAWAMPAGAGEPEAGSVTVPAREGKTERLICRRIDVSGSRLRGPRVCRTRQEWQKDEMDARDATRRLQRSRESTHGEG